MKKFFILLLMVFTMFLYSCKGEEINYEVFNINHNNFYVETRTPDSFIIFTRKPDTISAVFFNINTNEIEQTIEGDMTNKTYYLHKEVNEIDVIDGIRDEQEFFNTLDEIYRVMKLDVFVNEVSLKDFIEIEYSDAHSQEYFKYELKEEKIEYYEEIFTESDTESIYLYIFDTDVDQQILLMFSKPDEEKTKYRILIRE